MNDLTPLEQVAAILIADHRGAWRNGKENRTKVLHRCLFHPDPKASADYYPDEGFYYCHACVARYPIGDVFAKLGIEFSGTLAKLRYQIRNERGEVVAIHERTETATGKQMPWLKPDGTFSKNSEIKPDQMPLYGVELLGQHSEALAVLVEGEKPRDALQAACEPSEIVVLGTVCGAGKTPCRESLEPLRGREVALWADNDDRGREHMRRIGAVLVELGCKVIWWEWRQAISKGDAADFVRINAESEDMFAEIEETEWATEPQMTAVAADPALQAIPFPVEALPPSASAYVRRLAQVGLALDYCGPAALAMLSGAVGAGTVLRLSTEWDQKGNLWVALIGEPGTGKSPAIRLLRKPFDEIEKQAMEVYRQRLKVWQALPTKERNAKEAPIAERMVTSDATMEALALRLYENPGGLLLMKDELRSWLHGLGQYKARSGADRAKFLELWTGLPWMIDRVRDQGQGTGGTIYIPEPYLAHVGGLQESLLELLDMDDGLRDRYLLAWVRDHEPGELDDDGDTGPRQRWAELIERLCGLRTLERVRTLSADDREAFRQAQRRHREIDRNQSEPDHVRSWARKANEHLARIALVLSETWREDERMASVAPKSSFQNDHLYPGSLRRAQAVLDYFLGQQRGLFIPKVNLVATQLERSQDEAVAKLARWLENRPEKKATHREIIRANVAGIRTRSDFDRLATRYDATHPGHILQERAGGHDIHVVFAPAALIKGVGQGVG